MSVSVTIDLATATICFLGNCYPALIGHNTPTGTYTLVHYSVKVPAFGDDILAFHEDRDGIFAIHRVIDVPGQNRQERLKSENPENRKGITQGCVNIDPNVYLKLVDCCSNSQVEIK